MTTYYSKHSLYVAIILAALLSMVADSSIATEWKGREIEKDGLRHIINPGIPMEGVRDNTTITSWRIGGDTENDVLFGLIDDVARDADGVSYLLDSQLSTVHVFSPEGDYLRSIGREGDGPGEFRSASDIMLLPNGTLCVLQLMPARAVLLTVDGAAAGDHPLPTYEDGGSAFLNGGSIAAGQIVLYMAKFFRKETSFGLQTSFVRADSNGGITTTYWKLHQEVDMANVTFDEKGDAPPIWAVGTDGRFFINNKWDAYYIEVIGSDGTSEYVIEREYEHFKRTPEDFKYIESLQEADGMAPVTDVSETHRDVSRLLPRENGELWVLSSRGKRDIQPNTIGKFDVFDRQGRYVRQVIINGPFVPGRDGFYIVGEFVYIVTNIGEFAGRDQDDSAAEDDTSSNEISVLCVKLNDM